MSDLAGRVMGRRRAIGLVVAAAAAGPLAGAASVARAMVRPRPRGRGGKEEPLFSISLAEWSLHRTLFAGRLDHLDFARMARETYGLDAVEYVNQFFMDKAGDAKYIAEMKKRADDVGVRSLLIMCDGIGALGEPEDAKRLAAVEGHKPWVLAAKELGCHSIRVNAASQGEREERSRLAADGLRRLTEFAATHDLNVIVENHGGLTSDGAWLAATIRRVDHPRCGTLPDFGNFQIREGVWYDRYRGVAELMPFARAVSAKSHDFDEQGDETHTDFRRMMKIVLDAGYRGHVGIEYEGERLSEDEGIRRTKALLERIRDELA